MSPLPRKLASILLLACSALLAACGGGGGGGGGGGSTGAGGGGSSAGGGGGSSSGAISLSATSVTFNAAQGGAVPADQVVNVSVNGGVFVGTGVVAITTSQSGGRFNHRFDITGTSAGEITITPGVTADAGSFTGTITVNGCSNSVGPCNHVAGSPQTINVAYNVAGLSANPDRLAFFATTGSNPASKTITLAMAGGSASWTSHISVGMTTNWLSATPSSGLLNSSAPSQIVTLNVNTTALSEGVYTGGVQFTNGGSLAKWIGVTLILSNPMVNFVSPYVVPAGVPGDVIIRGHGFARLTNTLVVQLNGTPITASVVSDTEIQATVPGSLAAGAYAISVSDGGTPLPNRGALKLLLINPPAYTGQTIARATPSPSQPSNLIYDAERQALLLIDGSANRIERYAYDTAGGTWTAPISISVGANGGNPRIALSPDGTEVLKTSGSGTVLHWVNPLTLAPLGQVDASSLLGAGSLNMIAFGNDGGAIGNASSASGIYLYRYDMPTRTFTPVSSQPHMLNRLIVASADGDTLVMPSVDPANTQPFTYDASEGTVTGRSGAASSFNPVAVNRTGSRIILVNNFGANPITVYNESFNALGSLPNGANGWVLTPHAHVAYAYYPAGSVVRKFDLDATPVNGIFPEIGSGTAVASPGTSSTEMTISPDGGTLFLAGTANVIVLPAP